MPRGFTQVPVWNSVQTDQHNFNGPNSIIVVYGQLSNDIVCNHSPYKPTTVVPKTIPRGSMHPNSSGLIAKIHDLNGFRTLRSYYLGTWTLRDTESDKTNRFYWVLVKGI